MARTAQSNHSRRIVRCSANAAEKLAEQVVVVLGMQWGDEGKGKLVDILARQYDIVARAQVDHVSVPKSHSKSKVGSES